jgi:hypothetical protein
MPRLSKNACSGRERHKLGSVLFTTTNVPTYDSVLPPDGGLAFSSWGCASGNARCKSGTPVALLPSGLLGPVTLRTAR